MPDAPVSLETIYRVAGLFEQERVVHAFIGGVALGAWAIPRGTFDLDLAVSVPEQALTDLFRAFEAAGFVLDPVFARGFRDRIGDMEMMHVQMPVGPGLLTVDLFLASTPFLVSVLERRVKIDMGLGALWVCTAADIVLFKLLAGRRKDQVDLENVLIVQGLPEPEYLAHWSRVLGIEDRLAQLRRQAGSAD